MLELLLDECRKREIDFSPKAINLDFEIATHNAFRHFSQTLRSGDATFTWNKPGCGWQLSWAWKKTMKTRTVMFISGCAFYLDCLSLDQTKYQGFYDWHSFGFTIGLQKRAFWAVLVKTLHWRKRLSTSLWALDEIDRPRTTNCCESFHKYFQHIMNGHNPNIFKFVHKLDSLQVLTQMKTQRHRAGETSKK